MLGCYLLGDWFGSSVPTSGALQTETATATTATTTKQAIIAVAEKYHFYYLLPLSVGRR